jgi:hypothetical protein
MARLYTDGLQSHMFSWKLCCNHPSAHSRRIPTDIKKMTVLKKVLKYVLEIELYNLALLLVCSVFLNSGNNVVSC